MIFDAVSSPAPTPNNLLETHHHTDFHSVLLLNLRSNVHCTCTYVSTSIEVILRIPQLKINQINMHDPSCQHQLIMMWPAGMRVVQFVPCLHKFIEPRGRHPFPLLVLLNVLLQIRKLICLNC